MLKIFHFSLDIIFNHNHLILALFFTHPKKRRSKESDNIKRYPLMLKRYLIFLNLIIKLIQFHA